MAITAFALLAATVKIALADTNVFTVTNRGATFYVVNGTNNPSLTLERSKTYTFTVNASGHPFWITTAPGAGDAAANAFSTGINQNGVTSGTIVFAVPASAPSTLFYQCAFHDSMNGFLNIVDPTEAGVDAPMPAWALVLLVILVLVAVTMRTDRRRSY